VLPWPCYETTLLNLVNAEPARPLVSDDDAPSFASFYNAAAAFFNLEVNPAGGSAPAAGVFRWQDAAARINGVRIAPNELTVNIEGGVLDGLTVELAGDAPGQVAPNGNVTGGTPADYTTSFTYDADGRLLTQTDPAGRTMSTTYDADGNKLTSSDGAGHTTTNTYDLADRLTSTTGPDGTVTNDHYNANGWLTSSDDGHGHTTTNTFDDLGDLLTSTDPTGAVTTNTYSLTGLLLTATAPNGGVTTSTYDAAGHVLTVTDPDGGITTTSYDADGRQVSVTDADGNTTSYSYDGLGNQTVTSRADGSTVTNAHNTSGELTSYTDGAGNVTRYTYDDAGRELRVTDPLSRVTSYTYDADGNQLTVTDPDARVTTNIYDHDDRLVGVSYSDGSTPSVSYTYNSTGARATMTDGTGTSTYTYDSASRLSHVTNGAAAEVSYTYDSLGRIATLTYPDGSTITRGYNADGRLTSVTDANSNTTSFGYDGDGNIVTTTHPDGTVDTTTVDAADQTTQVKTTTAAAATLADFGYTYTPAGVTASISDSLDTALNGDYTHSPLQQLTTTPTGAGSAYAYDAAGNLTTLADGTTLAYDDGNQLTTATPATGPGTTYGFGGVGDRSSTTTASTVTSYGYNQNSQLTSSTGAGGTASYTYDGDGLRATTTISSTTNAFVWDDQTADVPLLLTDGVNDYIYGPDGDVVEQATVADGSPTYLHADANGSTRLLTNGSGTVVGTASYDVYGNTVAHTGTATSPFGYAGEYTDASGLIYLRARYYDPATGQFLTIDPAVDTTHDPYLYVAGDPLDGADPTGLFPKLLKNILKTGLGEAEGTAEFVEGVAEAANPANPHPIFLQMLTACAASDKHYGGGVEGAAGCLDQLNPVANIRRGFVASAHAFAKGCYQQGGALFAQASLGTAALATPGLEGAGAAGDVADLGGAEAGAGGAGGVEQFVYRVHGGDSGPLGHSWTPENPLRMANPRAQLGLPKGNSGQYLTKARVNDLNGVTTRPAPPCQAAVRHPGAPGPC
jgi:RHS repeat-associated protein